MKTGESDERVGVVFWFLFEFGDLFGDPVFASGFSLLTFYSTRVWRR